MDRPGAQEVTTAAPSDMEALPRWDTSNIYSSLDGEDYKAAFAELERHLADLEVFFDAHGIRRLVDPSTERDAALKTAAATLEDVLARVNDLATRNGRLRAFVYAFFTTDSYNAVAAREISKLEILGTRRQKLDVRLRAWIGSLAPKLAD